MQGDSRKGVYREVRSKEHVKLLGHNLKLCSDHVTVGLSGLNWMAEGMIVGQGCWWPGDADVDEGL